MACKRPNGYWKAWENLAFEIEKLFVEHPELERQLPAQDWLHAHGYSALANGTRHHGGLAAVREQLGQQQNKKPRGYWASWENVKRTIEDILDEHPEPGGRLPSQQWLNKNGYSSLCAAIWKHYGGMNVVRQRLNEQIVKHSAGHYSRWENVIADLQLLWKKHPELQDKLPSQNWLCKHGYAGLAIAIQRKHRGFRAAREKLGQEQALKNPHGYYKDETRVVAACEDIWKQHPELDRRLPSQQWLQAHGYSTLALSIIRYHHGFRALREKLKLTQPYRYAHGTRNEFKDWNRLREELEKLCNDHPEFRHQLPPIDWFHKNGYYLITVAIRKYHGGMVKVRKKLGQEIFRQEKGYWMDIENVVVEAQALMKKHDFTALPSEHMLRNLGYHMFVAAVHKYHGGVERVREIVNQRSGINTIKEQLEEIIKEYLKQP